MTYYGRALTFFRNEKYEEALKDYNQYLLLEKEPSISFYKNALDQITEIEKILKNKEFASIAETVKDIKELLKTNDKEVTHYTGFTTAKLLILENSEFRLSEGTFLNDTSEGKELFSYLSMPINLSIKNSESIAELFSQKPFIGSFVPATKHDDLALWRMYGKEEKDEAKGCAITIDKQKLIEAIKNKLVPINDDDKNMNMLDDFIFYRVAYKSKEDEDCFTIPSATPKEIKNLNKLMKELKTKTDKFYVNKKIDNEDKQNAIEKINEISYLFKSIEYQYEHELRLVVKGIGFDPVVDKAIPKVFIELVPLEGLINKITLGSKVAQANEWASTMSYHLKEKNCKANIYISHLPFK
jgi:hypothetical protein